MKFKTALRYRVIYQVRSLAIYFGFYALFGILFPLIGLLFSNDVNTVSSDAVIPCLVFMGILSFLGVNTDFKLFIQNGLSRWTIFLVNFVSNAILSLVGSLAVLVLIKVFSGNFISHFQLSMKLIDVYAQGNFFMSWWRKKTHCFIAVINDSYFTGHDCTIRGGTNAPENAPCLASNGWLSIHWFYCPTTSSDNQLLCWY